MNTAFGFAPSMPKSQISRQDNSILTWFQDIFKLIDVATNVCSFNRSKDMTTSYLKGWKNYSPGPL